MRGCGEIGIAQALAGEPITRAHQPADIGEMITHVVARRTDRLGIGRSAAGARRHLALVQALHGERSADLGEELVVEPTHEPAHLYPWPGLAWQQTQVAQFVPARL